MELEAERFIEDVFTDQEPRWLSFVGDSGTGKTFLASLIIEACWKRMKEHPSLLCGIGQVVWVTLLRQLRDSAYWRLDDLRDCNLVLIDDIGTAGDTAFALEQLYTLIEMRNRKWTIITSNLSLQEIAEKLDTRISSRLIRDKNVCVEVDTLDYALRPKQ